MKKWILACAVTLAATGTSAVAEDAQVPQKPLTLERVFASPSLNGPAPRAVVLSPDGKYLTSLRPRDDDRERFDLWAMDTATKQWRMLVDSTKLGTSGEISEAEKMQRERARIGGTKGIVSYAWSPDSKTLLVPVDGELFIATLDGKATRVAQSKDTLNAQISPKGSWISFVRNQNVHVQNLPASGKAAKQITPDGAGTVYWGEAEFVAQEEMDRTTGYWWSPDESRLAIARFDEAPVGIVSRAAIGAEGTKIFNQRYPAAGTPNIAIDLYIVPVGGGERIKVDLGKNRDIYLARVNWMPDGKSLIVQRQSRDQKTLDVLKVDAANGASTLLFSETSKTWINLHENLRILKDGSMLWTSERDGFSHIYRIANGTWTQLTRGNWSVRSLLSVDEKLGRIQFSSNKDDATQQHIFSVNLDGSTLTKLTYQQGWNDATMARGGAYAIMRHSSPNQPEQVYLLDTASGEKVWIEENGINAKHPYAPYFKSHVAPKFGTITAKDGTTLHTKLLLPDNMDPAKRYPVFIQVYNGPGAGRQVTKGWGGALQQYLQQNGWIVFSVDGRGSPDRGKAFEDPIYRAMGGVEVEDQLAGVAWLKQQSFVDPKKIAVYGWSYGGYMTLKLLQAAPGTFAAGVSGAPVTKWELYDTHYTERYMGDPKKDAAAYAKANALGDAEKIADPLLLIHGMADDNVVFDNSTALMGKLQGAAVPFETMVYPGQTHRVGGPKIGVHLWKTILYFLDRNVKNKED